MLMLMIQRLSCAFALALIFTMPAASATFTVTNTNDSGAGSLRQAILDANAAAGTDTIAFSIGSGPQLILVNSLLPIVTDTAIIDGRTQPGYNGTPLIGLDGSLFTSPLIYTVHSSGINLQANGSAVYALSVTSFHSTDGIGSAGIRVEANGCVVKKCWLGIARDGKTAAGNDHNLELAGTGAIIGGPGEGNVVSGGGVGITSITYYGSNTGSNLIQNNIIGLDPTGVSRKDNIYGLQMNAPGDTAQNNIIAGNTYGDVFLNGANFVFRANKVGVNAFGAVIPSSSVTAAIFVYSAGGNTASGTVGGLNAGDGNEVCGGSPGIYVQGSGFVDILGNVIHDNPQHGVELYQVGGVKTWENTIRNNGGAGVRVYVGGGNSIFRNSIYGNYAGIQLTDSYPLPNDAGDLDAGGNQGQNYPVITSASLINGATNITGTLNSAPNQVYYIEFYSSPQCNSSGYGEGRTYLGTMNTTTNGSGDAAFSVTFNTALTPGSVVTVTATDPSSDTSEFSKCAVVQGPGTISFSNSATSFSETVGTAAIPVTRSNGAVGTVSVNYTTASGTATAGSDFTAVSGTLTFADGQTVAYINVPVANDSIYEGNEQFTVSLSGVAGGAMLGSPAASTVTIIDDELPPVPTLSVNDISLVEGTGGDKQGLFTLTLSRPLTAAVQATAQLRGGTAQFGSDFDGNAFTNVLFNPGETTKQVPVTIHGDSTVEANETFTLTITNIFYFGALPSPVTAKATGTCAIINDDYGMQWIKVPVGSSARMNIQLGNATTAPDVATLTSSKPDVATVPPSFTYEAGRTSIGFDVQGVSIGTSLITAKLPASLGGGTLTAYAQVYQAVTLKADPDNLTIPVNTSVTVTLEMSPAPSAPVVLKVTPGAGFVQAPASVTIASNGTGTMSVKGITLGSGTLTVTLPDDNGGLESDIAFRVVDTPATVFVSQIAPPNGPTAGGTATTITGFNFAASCSVTFGSTPAASVSYLNSTSLSATTPPHGAGTVDVVVTCGSDVYTLTNGFTYVATAPHISSVLPSSGSFTGGTTVSVTGNDLRSCGVTFGGVPAKIILDMTPNLLVVVAPPHSAETVDVSLQCTDVSATLPSAFTYFAAGEQSAVIGDVNPLAASPGQSVTITGIRFRSSDAVTFGSAPAVVTSTMPTSHVAIVPGVAAGKVAVTLADPDGHQSTTGPIFTVLEPVSPKITSVSPTRVAPGGEIVIAGEGFRAPYTFALDDKSAGTIVDLTFNRAVVRIDPSRGMGSYTLGVLNAGGNLAAIGPKVDVVATLMASAIAPICSNANGGGDVTITGSGFQQGATVMVGTAAATNVRVIDDHTIKVTVPEGHIGWPTLTIRNPNGDSASLTRAFFYYSPYDKEGGCASTRTRGARH
jgi:hypothetical protein